MTIEEAISVSSGVSVDVTFPEMPFGGVQIVGIAEAPVQVILREGVQGPPGPQGPQGRTGDTPTTGAGINDEGLTPLVMGQSYVDVALHVVQADADWMFFECSILNLIDPSPLNICPGIITVKTTTAFRMQLNGLPDSNNYKLRWAISGTSVPPTPATTYLFTGPSSGTIGVAQTFTVSLPPGGTVTGTVTVTPGDGGGGGAFSPTSVGLTTAAPSATFTYTPASAGTKTLSVANSGGLTNPANISFIASTMAATGYSLTGPSAGGVGLASTNFTVTLTPSGGTVTGTVIVTPSDGGGGGTFTPTTVNLTTAAPSATFTYTPASSGSKTISATNSGGLTNPGSLTYTVTVSYTGPPVLDASYAGTGAGGSANQGLGGGASSTNCVGLGESFTSTGGMLDHAVGLGFYNGGAPPGNIVATLYAVSPAIFREGEAETKPGAEDEVNPLPGRGLDISLMAVPGTLLATSNTVAAASVPGGGPVTFNFVGAQRYVMNAGTQYVIAFEYNSGVGDQFVIVPWYYGTVYPGNMVENDSGVIPPDHLSWYVHGSDHDIGFEVWVVKPD